VVPITPDDKNWTWVLERPCPECGFDASAISCRSVAGSLLENAAAWPSLLELPTAQQRPSDDKWSTLEYACHVRDVFLLFDKRLTLMLENDDPLFENWDQDKTAVEDRYDEQDPAQVADEILASGAALADSFDSVPDDAWSRTGSRSDGSHFTIDSFSRYLLHDPVHHLHDVTIGLESLDSV
jgi:DinB superfamily